MPKIEVQVRSFISSDQYEGLLKFFNRNAELLKQDYQETYYFDSNDDLRIQKNEFSSRIWLKKGELHDNFREEIEIKLPKEDFEKLEQLFLALGYNIQIKWLRKRFEYKWKDLIVSVDYTKGYGYILEIEKLCNEPEKEQVLNLIKDKFNELNIPITPKEEFDTRYKHYKENWKILINN